MSCWKSVFKQESQLSHSVGLRAEGWSDLE